MQVDIDIEDARWDDLGLDPLVHSAGAQVLTYLGHDPLAFELSVLACDDARIHALNAQFRGQDKATNVLSWPTWDLSADVPGDPPEPPETGTPDNPEAMGDLALAYETCLREANEQHKDPRHHVTHLIVHSVLHLLGYDHETDEDAVLMEETERSILALMGIADPYAEQDTGVTIGAADID